MDVLHVLSVVQLEDVYKLLPLLKMIFDGLVIGSVRVLGPHLVIRNFVMLVETDVEPFQRAKAMTYAVELTTTSEILTLVVASRELQGDLCLMRPELGFAHLALDAAGLAVLKNGEGSNYLLLEI